MEELAAAMHRELEAQREYLGGEAVRTHYFGGGTPSLCPPGTIAGLLDHAGEKPLTAPQRRRPPSKPTPTT